MGVYIKGMEMPTSCRACQLKMNCDECEGWECVCVPLRKQIGYLDDLLADKRRDDCPLVPVPPHGRCIDADAVEKMVVGSVNQEDAQGFMFTKIICQILKDAPTIIPAESIALEEEKNDK